MNSGTKRTVSLKTFIFSLIAVLLVGFMTAFAVAVNIYTAKLAGAGVGKTPSASKKDDKLEAAIELIKSSSYYDLDDATLIKSIFYRLSSTVGDNYA